MIRNYGLSLQQRAEIAVSVHEHGVLRTILSIWSAKGLAKRWQQEEEAYGRRQARINALGRRVSVISAVYRLIDARGVVQKRTDS